MNEDLKDGLGCVSIYLAVIVLSLIGIWITKLWPLFHKIFAIIVLSVIVGACVYWLYTRIKNKDYMSIEFAIAVIGFFFGPTYFPEEIIDTPAYGKVFIAWVIMYPLSVIGAHTTWNKIKKDLT